jgi:hypothetical protein
LEVDAAIRRAVAEENAARIAATRAILDANPSLLTNKPSYRGGDRTLREWAEFALDHGGISKQLEVCRVVEANLEAKAMTQGHP